MRLALVVGEDLPRAKSYDGDRIARAFWRASYKTGRDYARSPDVHGKPMLWKHDREKPDSYERRLNSTKPRNHAGPIIRRYNDFVFRTEATRSEEASDPIYALLIEDADGNGTPLDRFMRTALLVAQVDREAFIQADTTKAADGAEMTVAQASAAGVRPILRRIDADSVLWAYYVDGVLVECLVLLEDAEGRYFARWYGPAQTVDVTIDQPTQVNGDAWKAKVVEVSPPTAHGYDGCPIVVLRPQLDQLACDAGESQIHPLAEAQQKVFNDLSLLSEEIYNVCFSQIIATGVAADQVKDVEFGSSRLLCLPNEAAKFQVIGADPAQATSIRQSIEDEQRELYRVAGVDCGDPTANPTAPMSGVALAFKFNDLAANLSALAKATEDAENAALDRLFSGQGREKPAAVMYPTDFDLPVIGDELSNVIRVVTVQQLPDVLKRHMIQRFADRSLGLDEDEAKELETELAAFKTPDPTAAPGAGGFHGT